uniref:Uncharacterized protein n=1 Tax=Rhizophora mucronata TaxID=61149 RepID=A0A2P2N521_RHIMU
MLSLASGDQLDLQITHLDKPPEYFDLSLLGHSGGTLLLSEDEIARLRVNQFWWLDFIV